MHNVISSCFFPSGELCWAEGGGWLYVWEVGVVVGAEVILFLCFFFSSHFLFLSVSHFFDFFLMLSIYFADCVAAVWSHASGIFGVLAVRYFYWEIKKRENTWGCVHAHTSICVCVCVWGMLMGVQKQQWKLLHHISTLFLGLCYVNAGEKLADSKCFLFTRR